MGKIKLDIDKSSRQFEQFALSDINTIYYLIKFRDKVDIYYRNKTDNFYRHAGNIQDVNQELIALYVSLDQTIKKCNFTQDKIALIKLLEMGYTFGNIASFLTNTTSQQIKNRFKTICRKIVKKNKQLNNINIYFNYIKTEWKKCSKCGDILPMNDSFFYREPLGKDGFKTICIECSKNN